jgi:hypothetical protein
MLAFSGLIPLKNANRARCPQPHPYLMKHLLIKSAVFSLAISSLVSCGSVSASKPAAGTTATVTKSFSKVIVRDFSAGPDSGADAATGAKFAGIIASEIKQSHPGTQVLRTGKPDGSTLVISGVITRFVEGNAALRLLVGMGAGSSYFDANIQVTDGGNNASVTSLHADKNSWGLGGGIAASQTVDTFMNEAAKKTAAEVSPRLK